jgi:hypothetical protein
MSNDDSEQDFSFGGYQVLCQSSKALEKHAKMEI